MVIDIGNTFVKMVCYEDGIIAEQRVALSDREAILGFCRRQPFAGGIYCSVVDVPADLEREWSSLPFGMLRYESGVTPVPLKSRYQTPLTLGADRMAASVGAWARWPGRNILVVDVGTCATFDFVSADGTYLGGNISPGIRMRLKAMHQQTGRLPLVEPEGDVPDFGISTETALRCGALKGIAMETEGYVRHFAQRFERPLVCFTGGDSLDVDVPGVEVCRDRHLVARGLDRILRWNQSPV